jgi:hypothetical protein
MKKNILILLTYLVFNINYIYCQDSAYVKEPFVEKRKLKDNISLGGNIGLSFGDITFINLSPRIGYKVNEKLSSGVGITYQYLNDKRYDPDFISSIYGGSIFSTFTVIEDFFLQTELEILNVEKRFSSDLRANRIFIPVWLVGGGYRVSVGGNSFLMMTLLYDLIQDTNSPYGNNLIIRGGINIGL